MTARQRVLTCLRHEEPDCVPLDLGGALAGINTALYDGLLRHCGLRCEERERDEIFSISTPCTQLLEHLGVDTRWLALGSSWPFAPRRTEGANGSGGWACTDEWGVERCRPAGGHWYDISRSPLREASLATLESYPFPDPWDPARYAGLEEAAGNLAARNTHAVCFGFVGVLFEQCWYLRGMEQFLCDLVLDPIAAEVLLERVLNYWVGLNDSVLPRIGRYLDVVAIGDDLGHQGGLIVSPCVYRKLIKPRHRRLVESIRAHTSARVALHSCGSVADLIPDFIEIGIDILNPVQPTARDMDTGQLKRRFGREMVFWGGFDTQHVLPKGDAQQIESEARRRITDLAPGGGYVFAPVHALQSEVPPASVLSMFRAAREHGVYPVGGTG